MTLVQPSTSHQAYSARPSALAMQSKIIPAPEYLKEHVACFRTATYTGQGGFAIQIPVTGLPGIVFQHNNGQTPVENITTPSRRNCRVPTLYVYGQITEPSTMNYKKGPYTMTQVILKPHALNTLLGMNASALIGGLVALDEFSARDLNDRLLEAANDQQRIALLAGFLLARFKRVATRDRLVEESLRLIHKHRGSINVSDLLARLHISERHFERRFSQTVGVSPQFYIRVRRFNQAVRLMKTRQFQKLTDIAYALNFYDQSHFIRDIKAFSGLTPKDLSQTQGDFLHRQAGYFYV